MKSPDSPQSIAQQFLQDTNHLGPEGQKRVLDLVLKANQVRKARESGKVAQSNAPRSAS
jgi:hypothetical protein